MVRVIDETWREGDKEGERYLGIVRGVLEVLGRNYEVSKEIPSIVIRDRTKTAEDNVAMRFCYKSLEITVHGAKYLDDAFKVAEACTIAAGKGTKYTLRKQFQQ